MADADSIFRYDVLAKFLHHVKDQYPIYTVGGWDGGAGIILRHDVDLDIGPAYSLAKLERECEVRSSFFILLTTPAYNPATVSNRRMLREMTDWGFEIGLHFDPTVYGDVDDTQLKAAVDQEAGFLAGIIGTAVRSVSIHSPSLHGRCPIFEGYCNAYDRAIFQDATYWSESRMVLRKDIWQVVAQASEHPVQLLMHPFHFSSCGKGYVPLFGERLRRFARELDESYRPANSTFRTAFPSSLADLWLNPVK